MGKIKAVVFDMDGVLFDTERVGMEAWREIAEERGLGDIEKAVVGCVGLNVADARALFYREYGEDFPFDEYHEACRARFKEKLKKELPQKAGAKEILAYLKKESYRVALASSTNREDVLEHLERAGMTEYFQEIISGDMVKHSKPQPDIYLMACEALLVEPDEALAIEDSPNGIRSAYAAGMKPVMVPDMIPPSPEIEKLLCKKCGSLLEVMEYIREIG